MNNRSLDLGDVRDNGLVDLFYVYLRDLIVYVAPFIMIVIAISAVSLLINYTIKAIRKADDDDDPYDTHYY